MDHTCSQCGMKVSADRAQGLCPACLARMIDHPSRPPADENPLAPDQEFHGLRILGLVGRGGMGIVYKARHLALDRSVALKILPRALAEDPGFRMRFEREAKTLAGLVHPNIVGVHDSGIEGDLTFLIMEYVDGQTLRQVLRERRMPTDQALLVALKLCEGLEFAHTRGVVHRDIKPDNILLDAQGAVKITDFGLAKMLGSEPRSLTESDLVIGTPHYMAPEQLEKPKNVDHRADLYSMGVLIYEMLTGELPIGNFDPPSRKTPLNPRLDSVVLQALAKEPDRRFQRASELRAAILQVVPALGTARPPVSPTHRRFSSNIELECTCGWTFFVAGTSRGFVNCPSCRAPVPTANNRPPTARVPVPRKTPRKMSKLTLAIVATAGILGILLAVLVVVLMDRTPTTARDPRTSPGANEIPVAQGPRPQDPAPPRAPASGTPAPAAPAPARQFIDYDHQIDQVVARCNLAGIVATVLLHSNRAPEHDELQDRIRAYERELKMLVAKRAEQSPEVGDAVAPPHFEGGDRLVSFGGKALDPLNTAPFAEELKAWLGRFRAGISEQATVFRASLSTPLEMRFPERTKELSALTLKLGLVLGDSRGADSAPTAPAAGAAPAGPAPASGATPIEAFPPLLVAELRGRLASVHPYYKSLLGVEDSARLDALAGAARGTLEDFEFVKFRVLPLLNRGAAEYAEFGGSVADLESKVIQSGTSVDILHFKDGRKLEGSLEEETEETVKLRSRFGSVKFPRADIARIEKGKGSGVELRTRYAAAKGKKEELLALGAWCKEHGLAQAKELAWWSVLLLDPGQERCRTELGLEKTPGAADPSVQVRDGKIEWNGKTFTVDELQRELESLGYVLLNGMWCEKVVRTFKIDNLYRDEGKYILLGTGAGVRTRTENREEAVYSVATRTWGTRTKQVTLGRYIGGGPPSGLVHIQIDSPGDLIECRVKARSQVTRSGDFVTVSVVTDPQDSSPKPLYSLGTPGELWPTYDASDKVRGLTKFCVRAQITGAGMFLPCDATTQGVFEVRFTYGKPLERLNATLGTHREGPPLGLNTAAPAPVRRTGNLRVEEVVSGAAESASARLTLGEMMAEMRRLTDGLVYTRDVTAPVRFGQLTVAIHDPLAPRLEELPQAEQTLLASWYGTLPQNDRKEFANFYGLWCCRTRALQRPSGR